MENSIIADLKDSYGLNCNQIIPVTGGWLNQKWKVSTDKGDVLVKQYSPKRYNREKLKRVEASLQREIILEKHSVPCPYIWQCDGQIIRLLDDGTNYMVMDFCSGKTESSDTTTLNQMHSLGNVCGFMHKVFSTLPEVSVEGYPIRNNQVIDLLWDNYNAGIRECSSDDVSVEYRNAVFAQEPILKQLTPDFFDKFPKGVAHEDFNSDNILFDVGCVSAIVDFDRNHYSYIWHDIGRALLSFALEDNIMNVEKIHAFLDGYSHYFKLTLQNIADALRLSWCIEAPWWIHPEVFIADRERIVRFKDEMLWLTEHWFEIDDLIC